MAAIMKWNPRETLPDFFSRFDRDFDRLENMFFRHLLPRRFGRFEEAEGGEFMPEVDLLDREGEYAVVANVPGYKREELDITVSPEGVVLKGCHSEEQKEEKGTYLYQERSRGCFERSFRLPTEIRLDEVSAEMDEGVLTVHLPKAKGAATSRRIEVQGQ
ncbi:MAG: Hsp20 family protein [Deltaproteobacteria bacterium]|nr:Hsp20 family protein [Deltaproteobacteria bacterium]